MFLCRNNSQFSQIYLRSDECDELLLLRCYLSIVALKILHLSHVLVSFVPDLSSVASSFVVHSNRTLPVKMRRTSAVGHGPVVMPLAPADRLRLYRRCFHELDEQLLQLQLGGSTAEVRRLQAEVRSLEELIMVFTELNPAITKSKQAVTADSWLAEAALEGLDIYLVTDILMLSATSPWTMYIAERSQWLLGYVSPSSKRTTGWLPQELVGTPAWSACHPDDIPILQRMLHLRDNEVSGGSVIYRRMRKDRTFATMQATGRPVGTRWYAWVEQDILNFSPGEDYTPSPPMNQNRVLAKPAGVPKPVVDGEIPVSPKWRRQSVVRAPPMSEAPNPQWQPLAGNRPVSPETPFAVLDRTQSQRINKGKGCIAADSNDTSEKAKPAGEGLAGILQPADLHVRGQESVPMPVHLKESLSMPARLKETVAKPGRLNTDTGPGGEGDSLPTTTPSKVKTPTVTPRRTARTSASTSSGPPPVSSSDKELLRGKKVLLAEDDAVNRKIGQRLLQTLECNVTVACNGQDALDVLRRAPTEGVVVGENKELSPQFDLVLMDLQMPVMDGTHAVQLFRDWEAEQEPPRKRMTIFALTANVSDRDMVICAQSGFDEFVSKPLTLDKLVERLKKIGQDPAYNRGLDS